MKGKIKKEFAIIFDFDGTIANTSAYWKDIFNELSREFKFRKVNDENWGRLKGENTKNFYKEMNIPLSRIPAIMDKATKIFARKAKSIKPIAGMVKVLNTFKNKGHKLGILTSNRKENVEDFLRNNNLNLFDFIYSENDLFGKDKAMKRIIKKEDLNIRKVFYVGDEDRDIKAAKKAGVKVIAVTWGSCSEKILLKEKPDFLAKAPKDLNLIFKT